MVLSKLLNHSVLQLLFCKIGMIIIVPTIGFLGEEMNERICLVHRIVCVEALGSLNYLCAHIRIYTCMGIFCDPGYANL